MSSTAPAEHGLALQAEAVERLAEAADGYRTLDGWLARLALEARLGLEGGTGARARGRSTPRRSPPSWPRRRYWPDPAVPIDAIARAVAARFGVRLGAAPRAQPAGVGRRGAAPGHAPGPALTGSSFAAIGAYFGGRDPATVRHACQAAADRLAADPALAAVAAAIAAERSKNEA